MIIPETNRSSRRFFLIDLLASPAIGSFCPNGGAEKGGRDEENGLIFSLSRVYFVVFENLIPAQEKNIMAHQCEICGKGPTTGNNVSHAHNKTRRRWLPNLQHVRMVTATGGVRRVYACTRCIRSGAVVKPV